MHNLLKLLPLLSLLVTDCAPPTRSLCFNPDPVSGACRDAELLQAERNKERGDRERKAQRLTDLKQALQLANTQLAEKKDEIAAANDPQTVTRLSREHDDLVDEIINYLTEASLSLGEDLGTKPDKIGEHEQPITLHLKHDEKTSAILPVLGGLDQAHEVQVSYHAMQHKFAAVTESSTNTESSTAEEFLETAQIPPTLRIPLQLQFILDKTIYCGSITIDAEDNTGGEVDTQLAGEEGC